MFLSADPSSTFAQRAWSSSKHWLGQTVATSLASMQSSPCAGHFGILMYHRIAEPLPSTSQPTWNVTPRNFRLQISGLLKRGFRPWPLRKVLDHRANRLSLPDRVFVVTFDDAHECVYTKAWPVLRELNVPATVFLATAYLDSPEPFPFDDWLAKGTPQAAAESWRPLTRAQCLEMQSSKLIELGAHTHTHQDFRQRPAEFRRDLQWNLKALHDWFSVHHPPFAFPYGTKSCGFTSSALTQAVRELGLTCALTSETETARLNGDRFDWGRFQVYPHDTATSLAGKITGWYSQVRETIRAWEASGKYCWRELTSLFRGRAVAKISR